MRIERPQYGRLNVSRVVIQVTSCVVIAIAFIFAQDQASRSTALSAGVQGGLATPAASNVNLGATTTRTPTPRKTSRATAVPKAPTQDQAIQPVQINPRAPKSAVLDPNTVALYHFNSQIGNQVPDATGNYTGTLVGTATITTSALFGPGALGTSDMNVPGELQVAGNFGNLSAGTLEAYIDFNDTCLGVGDTFSMISLGSGYGNVQALSLYVPPLNGLAGENWLNFGILGPNGIWHWVTSGINPCKYLRNGYAGMPWPYDVWRWHHVAGTWGPRGLEIWVDGVLHGTGDGNSGFQYFNYCNPQLQTGANGWPPNPSYPICPYPHFSQTPDPAAYVGGLASANMTLLVGCDGTNMPATHCFKGRLDDVRLSNIQRQFDVSVDPPSSPTPTQTPVTINGAYSLDPETFALYHLDYPLPVGSVSTVVNEAGGHNGVLSGNAVVVPGGRYNSSVLLSNPGYVDIWSLGGNTANGTVEAWIKLSSNPSSMGIISRGADFGAHLESLFFGVRSTCGSGSTLCFALMDGSGQWHWADSGVNPTSLYCTWHHIAGTWGARGLEVWLDGTLRGANSGFIGQRTYDPSNDYTLLGCDSFSYCMSGMIDEVRLSTVQRTYSPVALGAGPLRRNIGPYAPVSQADSPFQVFIPFLAAQPQSGPCP